MSRRDALPDTVYLRLIDTEAEGHIDALLALDDCRPRYDALVIARHILGKEIEAKASVVYKLRHRKTLIDEAIIKLGGEIIRGIKEGRALEMET